MNLLFTVCARAGSKGVRGKNTKLFCGVPLVYYTIAAYEAYKERFCSAKNACLAVNTDSGVLIDQIRHTGADFVLIERKKELAGDVVAKKDVIKDTLREAERLTGTSYDVVVDLDVTSPIRCAEDIEGTIRTLLEDGGADIAYSVTKARRSPYFNMVLKNEDGYFSSVMNTEFVARQQVPECFDMNASVYAYARDYLLSERVNDRRALIWMMQDTGVLDIDSEQDLELMQVIAEYFYKKKEAHQHIYEKAMRY